MVMVPRYVPGVNPSGATAILIVAGVDPAGGEMLNHAPPLDAAVNANPVTGLEMVTCRGATSVASAVAVNVTAPGPAEMGGGAARTFRIRSLLVSATHTLPLASTVNPMEPLEMG
jgi:hypothetical protein